MKWSELDTKEQIENFLNIYENFEDSLIVKFWYDSGNFVHKDDPYIAEQYNRHDLTVRFDKGDYEVIIHHVPGRKCANCGEQVFSRETVKRLQEIMRSHPAMSKRRIETDFAA